jgi:hypothetical protein
MNALPSRERQEAGSRWYIHNATLMLNRFLTQPDEANKANVLAIMRDYQNAMRRGDVSKPMLPT